MEVPHFSICPINKSNSFCRREWHTLLNSLITRAMQAPVGCPPPPILIYSLITGETIRDFPDGQWALPDYLFLRIGNMSTVQSFVTASKLETRTVFARWYILANFLPVPMCSRFGGVFLSL